MKYVVVLLTVLTVVLTVITSLLVIHVVNLPTGVSKTRQIEEHGCYNVLEISRQFHVPELDLRGYRLNHHETEQWFLDRINYHREAYGIHPYSLYMPATITSIEHSLDMRDNEFGSAAASDGRTHQERHDRWFGDDRTVVTSAHTSTHEVEGRITRRKVNNMVDRIFNRERTREFLLNPTYYYIGVGFSVQPDGKGRLSITMVSLPDERAAHRSRTPEERIIHRQQYLERVRYERGWVAP